MKEFTNVESTVKKPQFWEDKYHVYALLKQEEVVINPDDEENKTIMYHSDYTQYTKEEWNDVITKDLIQKTLTQLDQSLETVRANKIAESKLLLEQYYKENPLFSTIHKAEGEYYAVTSDKQSYLLSMIALCEQSENLGIEFTPTWNATGEACEPWTKTELQQLMFQIASFVYPAVSKQQHFEKIIKTLSTTEEIQALEIDYGQDISSI